MSDKTFRTEFVQQGHYSLLRVHFEGLRAQALHMDFRGDVRDFQLEVNRHGDLVLWYHVGRDDRWHGTTVDWHTKVPASV